MQPILTLLACPKSRATAHSRRTSRGSPIGLVAAESWRQEFTALRQQRLAQTHPLGDLPLHVLERTDGASGTWHAQQVQLAGLSSAGRLIKAEGSGHMIHLYRPDLVVQAIREVIAASRSRN